MLEKYDLTAAKQTRENANTYHDQRDKIHPIPERMGVLYIIHYIYPALKADYLEEKHIALTTLAEISLHR